VVLLVAELLVDQSIYREIAEAQQLCIPVDQVQLYLVQAHRAEVATMDQVEM
jgi:hypothetical protein